MEPELPSKKRVAVATILAVLASVAVMGAQIAFLALWESPTPHDISDFFAAMAIAGFLGIILAIPTWPLALMWAAVAYLMVGSGLIRLRLPLDWRTHLAWIAAGLFVGATTVLAMLLERQLLAFGPYVGLDDPNALFWDEFRHLLPLGLLTGIVGALVWRMIIRFIPVKRGYRP